MFCGIMLRELGLQNYGIQCVVPTFYNDGEHPRGDVGVSPAP